MNCTHVCMCPYICVRVSVASPGLVHTPFYRVRTKSLILRFTVKKMSSLGRVFVTAKTMKIRRNEGTRVLLRHRPVSRPINACFSFSFFRTVSKFRCFHELLRSFIGREPTYRPEITIPSDQMNVLWRCLG